MTYNVGTVSARQSGKLVVRLSHSDDALDIGSRHAVLVLHQRLVVIAMKQMLCSCKRINCRPGIVPVHLRTVLATVVVGRQRVTMQPRVLLEQPTLQAMKDKGGFKQ